MQELLDIMSRLRDPETGCPWDLQQSYQSLTPMTLEEAYEVADAIDRGDVNELKGELGDLLLHIVFYSQIAKEQGDFTFDDVLKSICEKMIRRHPHVFGDEFVATSEAVKDNWEEIKKQERLDQNCQKEEAFFAGITQGLPALKRAKKLKKRAATIGFDWDNWKPVAEKVEEELNEIKTAIQEDESPERVEEELGDLLLAVANLSSQLGFDPENALRKANRKFECRVEKMIDTIQRQNKRPENCSLSELSKVWEQIKHSN